MQKINLIWQVLFKKLPKNTVLAQRIDYGVNGNFRRYIEL